MYICICVNMSGWLAGCLSACLLVCLSICPSVCGYVCMYVCIYLYEDSIIYSPNPILIIKAPA